MKDRRWIPWAVCIAYYLAVFLLTWKNIMLLCFLSFIPFFIVGIARGILGRDIVEYLYSSSPEKWGKLALDMHTKFRGSLSFLDFIFSKEATDDLELIKMKNMYKTALQLHIFTGAVLVFIVIRSYVAARG